MLIAYASQLRKAREWSAQVHVVENVLFFRTSQQCMIHFNSLQGLEQDQQHVVDNNYTIK